MNDTLIKICLNCGDRLLAQAKKCPHCGVKAKDFPLIDRNDNEKIQQIIEHAPNPKNGTKPKWEQNLDLKAGIRTTQDKIVAERKQKAESDGLACCPKCGSTSLSAHKKGFGIGKAVIGDALLGPIGLIAGNINAKKVRITCLKCGNQFWPGTK